METKEVQAIEARDIYRQPDIVLAEAIKASQKLKDIVDKKDRPVIINNEKYLEYADWQVLARFYGLIAKTGGAEPTFVETIPGKERAYGAKAKAEVIYVKTGEVVSGAEAYCLADEENWKDKPFFQLASMAQTRAGAKALRNALSWVAVLAGYKATPAEEMTGDLGEVMPFGKFTGKSFEQIHQTARGKSYLEWASKAMKNESLKQKIVDFLELKRQENMAETPEEVADSGTDAPY